MIKKLNIKALLIILMLCNLLFAQSDKILIYGNCNIDEANKISEYLKSNSNIDLGFEIASKAKFIVAIGVLNSCDILLIKSVFISEIFF